MMNAKRGVRAVGGAVLAAAILASCARPRTPAFEPALSRSRQYYQAGEFQKAIDVNADSIVKYPEERAVREEYIRTLEGIEKQARAAAAAEDYASAERLFSLLLDNFEKYKGLERFLGFSAAGLDEGLRLCRTALEERRTAQYLRAGDYERALGAARAVPPSRSADPGSTLAKTMGDIKGRADRAAAAGNYAEAGKAYAALAGHYAEAAKSGQKIPFAREALAEGLKKCRAELTRRGLEHYRKGELTQAISVWQGLLRFDPGNAEIRKAVETARQQQKGLRNR